MSNSTTCSNCGAQFTNPQNCEFCGAAVPRTQQEASKPTMQQEVSTSNKEKERLVNQFIGANAEKFQPQDLMTIKARLTTMNENQLILIQAAEFRNPTTILLLAVFLGIERFWLGQVGIGILKILSYFVFVGWLWWFIDIFTAKKRAREYNFKKLGQLLLI